MKLKIFNREIGVYILLFLSSFGIYFIYYGHLILNLNSVLFGIEGDSLKNYYTFVHHIKNDKDLLNFSGLNFPFGEHIVYTDCQPLLTFILKFLPFTHGYLIGIMHGLILFSFIITPLILFRIFLVLNVQKTASFFSSLAIAVLAPQIHRLGGHFALAYGCIIPLGILLLLNFMKNGSNKYLVVLCLYNSILFLIHPYFGLGLSLFCLSSILIASLIKRVDKRVFLENTFKSFIVGILPILAFKVFMLVTDKHVNRPDEPYGVNIMGAAANVESVFTPSFGPFTFFLKIFFKSKHVEWEALSYVGIFSISFLIINIILVPVYFKRLKRGNELTAMFLTSVLFLCFSFGAHVKLLRLFDIEISTLNQFRAFGRFAWYFYFLLPIFLVTVFSNFLKTISFKYEKISMVMLALVFFFFNMLEANYLLLFMTKDTFVARNIFNKNNLTPDENRIISKIKAEKFQAIMPLPVFHIGSEVYQRNGNESIAPAMIYSYHAGLPILSVMLSRTSLNESETALEILNRFKKERKILTLMNDNPILIIRTETELKKDELRVLSKLNVFDKNEQQEFYTASKRDFTLSESEMNHFITVNAEPGQQGKNIVFIHTEKTKPFIESRIDGYPTVVEIDSTTLEPGKYTVSFHYHLKEKKFRYIHNNLIVIKKNGPAEHWEYFTSVRSTSGFYSDFIVVEERINIEPHSGYRFVLNGPMKEKYWISDFLLKPEDTDVKMIQDNTLLYNNYPN